MKKLKIEFSISAFEVLYKSIELYITQFKRHDSNKNLEALILAELKPKLWAKAHDRDEVKLKLAPFQAWAIKDVLLYIPSDNIPIAEYNEIQQALHYLDQELLSV